MHLVLFGCLGPENEHVLFRQRVGDFLRAAAAHVDPHVRQPTARENLKKETGIIVVIGGGSRGKVVVP